MTNIKCSSKLACDLDGIQSSMVHPYTAKFYGAGKTTYIINYLNKLHEAQELVFDDIYFVTNSQSQALFKLLTVPIQFIGIEQLKTLTKTYLDKFPNPTLFVFDDIQNLKNDKEIQNIYTRGRHLNISLIFLEQAPQYSNIERDTDYIIP